MVDSGAKTSVISEELVHGWSFFSIRPASLYTNVEGSPVENILGETSITVRFRGILTDLDRVLMVERMMFPIVMGIDWVVGSATIKGVNGKVELTVTGD